MGRGETVRSCLRTVPVLCLCFFWGKVKEAGEGDGDDMMNGLDAA
jgi:hypothetical protein